MPNIGEDSGQGAVPNTVSRGGAARPNIPIIDSHQHYQAVVDDNVEYDREDSPLVHHEDGQRVPVYVQQVSIGLANIAF